MNQGDLSWCRREQGRSQSPRGSDEAANPRGAKGGRKAEAWKETRLQMKLPGVPVPKQGREIPPQWAWTEAVVWTERVVATLERGIIEGKSMPTSPNSD